MNVPSGSLLNKEARVNTLYGRRPNCLSYSSQVGLSLLVYNWNARQVRGNPNHALSPITHDNMMTPLFSILLGYIFQLSSTAKKKKTNTTERAQNALQATLNTGNNNLCIAVDQGLLWFWDCGSHQYRKLWAASRQASPLVEAEPKPRGVGVKNQSYLFVPAQSEICPSDSPSPVCHPTIHHGSF